MRTIRAASSSRRSKTSRNSYAAGTGRETRPLNLGEVSGDVFILNFKQHEGSLKLELDTGIGTLRSVTGYAKATLATHFDFAGSYVPDNFSASLIRDRVWQENLDFNIDCDRQSRSGHRRQLLPDEARLRSEPCPTPCSSDRPRWGRWSTRRSPMSRSADYKRFTDTFFFRTKEAWAGFVDATFHATDQLSINVGGRYSEETQDVSGYKLLYSTVTGLPTSCAYSQKRRNIRWPCLRQPLSAASFQQRALRRRLRSTRSSPRVRRSATNSRPAPISTRPIRRASAAANGTRSSRATTL